jgi:protein arginine kinase
MKIEELITNVPSWLNGEGEYSEIVLSSRIRLARNIEPFKFPVKASNAELKDILSFISSNISPIPVLGLARLSTIDKEILLERHIASNELLKNAEHTGIGILDGESISFMINEEDHLRIQCIMAGLNLDSAYKKLDELDDRFSFSLQYAFSAEFGYLTSCPSNVGIGMRASVILHLPALVHSGKIRKELESLSQGLITKGFYGNGNHIEGNFFQFSTRPTLGYKEEEIIEKLCKSALQVIKAEQSARELLLDNARIQIEDKIWRALYTLKGARLLSMDEFISLSSALRLGIGLGIIKEVKISTLNKLLMYVQKAHLQKLIGKEVQFNEPKSREDPADQDMRRALYVRDLISRENL